MNGARVLLAIPVYNEEDSLPSLWEKLAGLDSVGGQPVEVLFVDDGSSDQTPRLLERLRTRDHRVRVLTHHANLGLGAAVRTALGYALERLDDDDVLVTMDGDNTHDPALVPEMVAKLRGDGLDLVVASRFAPGAGEVGLGAFRRFLSRGASLFLGLFFPIANVRDYSSGFRAYRVGLLRQAKTRWGELVTTSGFDCMAEILAKLSRFGPRAGEWPLVLHYELKRGRSKMPVWPTIRGYFRLLRKAA